MPDANLRTPVVVPDPIPPSGSKVWTRGINRTLKCIASLSSPLSIHHYYPGSLIMQRLPDQAIGNLLDKRSTSLLLSSRCHSLCPPIRSTYHHRYGFREAYVSHCQANHQPRDRLSIYHQQMRLTHHVYLPREFYSLHLRSLKVIRPYC